MQITRLAGLVAATHTPFNTDGSLNLQAVETQARHLLDNQVNTVFIAGTTGECHSLTLDERLRLAERWMAVARGAALRVVIHVGGNSIEDCKTLAAHANRLGAYAVAAMAPCYFKPQDLAALVDWCAVIAASAPGTPLYYYDIPGLTGVNLPLHGFLEQAQPRIPTLRGGKFTNSDLAAYLLCLRACGGVFDVAWGLDQMLLGALAMGAVGAVGNTYNFAAPIYRRLIEHFQRGDLPAAREEQFRSARLIQTLARHGFMPAAKAVMAMLGVDVGPSRAPLARLNCQEIARLRADLEHIGFFQWLRP